MLKRLKGRRTVHSYVFEDSWKDNGLLLHQRGAFYALAVVNDIAILTVSSRWELSIVRLIFFSFPDYREKFIGNKTKPVPIRLNCVFINNGPEY